MEPFVSIVTPFYNTDDHLAECIESVLGQRYGNFEYLLVNNRSTDRSVEIVEGYTRRDSRIRLLHNDEFLTQLQNYNQALRQISDKSRYVKMVQADDAIFPHCIGDMVELAEAHASVGVVSSYRTLGSVIWPPGFSYTKTVMSGREAGRLCLLDDFSLFGSQTTLMIRADIVRSRPEFYAEDRLFADSDVVYEILRTCDFAFVHQVLSLTRLEEGSTWSRYLSYNPLLLDKLVRLKSFGRYYLSPAEYDEGVRKQERAYRRFLTESWLRRRESEFWAFHRKGLATIGEELNRVELLAEVPAVVGNFLLRPQKVGAGLVRRWRRRLDRSSA